MPRISRELSEQKKNFVLSKFKENPQFTIREIQEFLKVQFAGIKGGETMNPATVLALRNGPDIGQTSPIVSTTPPVETASTETIVSPERVLTQADVDEAFAPTPVVQTKAPEPVPAPVEGETYVIQKGYVQVTDDKGTYIRKVEQPVVVEA